mmetsp:Transcript_16628/g.47892  ORF Transcript_16628/g.47892 Transcript_16628/m.47892 type:complete len:561 (-) Transcript_16628:456-2138(-)
MTNLMSVSSSSPRYSTIWEVTYNFRSASFVPGTAGKAIVEEEDLMSSSDTGPTGAAALAASSALALSAAIFAALISARLISPVSRRCFRALMSRLASEGTNLRFRDEASSSAVTGADGGFPLAAGAALSLLCVIHAGRFETPLRPVSLVSGAAGGGGGGAAPGGNGGATGAPGRGGGPPSLLRRSSSSLLLLSSISLALAFRTSSLSLPSTCSALRRRALASLASSRFLNRATASRTSGAFRGSSSSLYSPPPAAAATLLVSSFCMGFTLSSPPALPSASSLALVASALYDETLFFRASSVSSCCFFRARYASMSLSARVSSRSRSVSSGMWAGEDETRCAAIVTTSLGTSFLSGASADCSSNFGFDVSFPFACSSFLVSLSLVALGSFTDFSLSSLEDVSSSFLAPSFSLASPSSFSASLSSFLSSFFSPSLALSSIFSSAFFSTTLSPSAFFSLAFFSPSSSAIFSSPLSILDAHSQFLTKFDAAPGWPILTTATALYFSSPFFFLPLAEALVSRRGINSSWFAMLTVRQLPTAYTRSRMARLEARKGGIRVSMTEVA